MDINTFSEMSAGKWVSQRTSHELITAKSDSGRSDLLIASLDTDAPAVAQLCQQHGIAPAQVTCGLEINWEGLMARDTGKRKGTAILVFIADLGDPSQGQVLHAPNLKHPTAPKTGRYQVGNDQAITLISETAQLYVEERIWFASPNLRLRTSLVKQGDASVATFFSEIRMGVPPMPATTAPE